MSLTEPNDEENAAVNENDKTQKLFQERRDAREDDGGEGEEHPYATTLSNSLPLPRTSNPVEQRQGTEQLESALAESPQRSAPGGADNNNPSDNWSESDGLKRSEVPSGESHGQGLGGTITKYNFDNVVFESQFMSAEE